MNDLSVRYRSHRPPSCTDTAERLTPKPTRLRCDSKKKKSEKSVPNLNGVEDNRTSQGKRHERQKMFSFNEIQRLKMALEKAEERSRCAQKQASSVSHQLQKLHKELDKEKQINCKLLQTLEQKELMIAYLRKKKKHDCPSLINISSQILNRTGGVINFESGDQQEEKKSAHKRSISFCDFNQEGRENESYEQRMKAFINSIGKFSDESEDSKRECFKKDKKRKNTKNSARDEKTRRLKR